MESLYAVIRTRGPAWQDATPLESQPEWQSHASFMNALERERFVILAGPLEGTPDVLLVVRAHSPDAIRSRLDEDPWSTMDLLRVKQITPWDLRIGTIA
jgi:uncharacterized protein YciI